MRNEMVAALLAVILIVSVGAGYFAGVSNKTTTSTITGPATTATRTLTQTTTSLETIRTTTTETRSITQSVGSGELGPWIATTSYPHSFLPGSCVINGGFIYCVGGNDTRTFYAPISSNGVGQWIQSTNLSAPIRGESCISDSNFIYCVGGSSNAPNCHSLDPYCRSRDAYFASLSPTGIGVWSRTTPYPFIAASPRCWTDSGHLYCMEAHFNGTIYTNSADVYFAPMSANGIGNWTKSMGSTTLTAGCSAINGFAYCFGGGECPPYPGDCYSPSYFALMSGGGLGAWNKTTDIPTAGWAIYVTVGPFIYYLSIPVFFAEGSGKGIGSWQTTTNYPRSLYPAACASSWPYIYCLSGGTNDVYFTTVGAPNPGALQLQNPPPYPRSEYLGPAWNGVGGCSVSVNGTFAGAPCFDPNIDNAVIFDCATAARTPAGCVTTVVSPTNHSYNYNVTIWYPYVNASMPNVNCAFKPSIGYNTPFYEWCASTGLNSFIIAQEIYMKNQP